MLYSLELKYKYYHVSYCNKKYPEISITELSQYISELLNDNKPINDKKRDQS